MTMIKQLNKVAEVKVSYRPKVSDNPIIKSSWDSYQVLKQFLSGWNHSTARDNLL